MVAKFFFGIASILVIRFLSVEDFAVYAIGLASINLVTSSISMIFNRLYIAGDIDLPTSPFLSYQLILIVFIFIFLSIIKDIYDGYFLLIFFVTISQVLFWFAQTTYQRLLKFKLYYLSEYLRLIFYLSGFAILFLNDVFSIKNIFLLHGMSSFIVFLIFGFPFFNLKDLLNFRYINLLNKNFFNQSNKYLILYSLVVILLSYSDIIMLRFFSNTYYVAVFGAAFTYYSLLQAVTGSVHKLMLPLVQKTESILDIKNIMNQYIKIPFLLFPIYLLIIFSSDFIIPFFDNNKYPDSIYLFKILTVSSYLSLCFSPYSNVIFKLKDNKFIFYLYLVASIVYLSLLPFIIQKYYAEGLVYASLCMWLVVNFSTFVRAIKKVNAMND